jgi:allantoate deiminase
VGMKPDARLLIDLLARLAAHSAPGRGVTRLAYDPRWCAAQRWLAARAGDLGLTATADAAGNLWLHPGDVKPFEYPGPVLATGSHLDTVRDGGRYDGAYGAVAGMLLAARALGGSGIPVVGFVTCEEEESRFRGGMMGARSLLGRVSRSELDSIRDDVGASWREALAEARAAGCAAALPDAGPPFPEVFQIAAELELHIEQGPVLEAEKLQIGVVEAIAGYRRIEVALSGASRHAGTTPMRLRNDALAAGAACILAAEQLAAEMGEPAVATAGAVSAKPGLFNVVPGTCDLRLEVRHSRSELLRQMAGELERRCRAEAARRGVALDWRQVSSAEPALLSPEMAEAALSAARSRGLLHRRMVSGAGHDTMVFAARGIPSLMLFVPSRGGVSHAPEEYSAPEDLGAAFDLAHELLTGWRAERDPLPRLNALPAAEARSLFERCCGSRRWVDRMLAVRPFLSCTQVLEQAGLLWEGLGSEDCLEAFRHHPRIGDLDSLHEKFAATATWAVGEQAGTSAAPRAVLEALARGNEAYERKFGYVFIVCATGRSAEEMLRVLEQRLQLDPEMELRNAAAEQARITRLRLIKWMRGVE